MRYYPDWQLIFPVYFFIKEVSLHGSIIHKIIIPPPRSVCVTNYIITFIVTTHIPSPVAIWQIIAVIVIIIITQLNSNNMAANEGKI